MIRASRAVRRLRHGPSYVISARFSPAEHQALMLAREHLRMTLADIIRHGLAAVIRAYSPPDDPDPPRELGRIAGFPPSVPSPRSLRYDPREHQRAHARQQAQTKAERAVQAINAGPMHVPPDTQERYANRLQQRQVRLCDPDE